MGMISPTTQVEACSAAKYIAQLPYTRFAVLKENYDYGIDNAREFDACIKKYKPSAQIVKETAANLGTKDYTSFINAMLAAKPQFIYTNVFGGDLVTFVKQFAQLGVKLPWATIWDLTALQAVGKNFPDKAPTYGYMRGPFFGVAAKYVQPFIAQFRKLYHNYPSDWSLMAMEAFIAYKQAVETAGTYTDTQKVMHAFDNETFTGPFGPIKINCLNGQGDVPEWVGKLVYNPKYGFATFAPGQWHEYHGSDVWPANSELKIPNQGQCSK
jgi:branched-chain amino acid transport system substrate-binding protein